MKNNKILFLCALVMLPLMVLSFMVEKTVWELNPFRLRLVNLLIFIGAFFVLYFFLCRQTSIGGIAETAVLLFALFPLNLDNITLVVGLCDLLMRFFGLLALYLLDLYLEKGTVPLGFFTVASYLLTLFSKEAVFFFLPIFLLHELARRKRLSYSLQAIYFGTTVLYWRLKSAVIGSSGIPYRFFPSLGKTVMSCWKSLAIISDYLCFHFDMICSCLRMRLKLFFIHSWNFCFFALWQCCFGRGVKKPNTSRPGYGSFLFWLVTS